MLKKKITSGAGIAIICYHALLLISLPFYLYYNPPGLALILVSIALFFATGISITAGYHRYYSHKAYKMNSFPESILLFFGTMAAQGSALRWSYDHRKHHAFVDTDRDPYSIKKGFWYAHMWWLMDESPEIEPKVVNDLLKNKMVSFQHRHYYKLMVFTNILAFLFTGWALGDFIGAFFIALWVRLLTLHHCTWFINSLAHTWGSKSFSKEHSAVDNYLISLLTFGEGYHNYHHTFANDYRNGIRWYNFDPTKWLIWALQKSRLAWDLKKVDFCTVQKRLVLEDAQHMKEQIKELIYVKKEILEQKVQEMSDNISTQIVEFQKLMQEYKTCKYERREKEALKELRLEIKRMKKSLKKDWKDWMLLSQQIMNLKPLAV